MGMVASDLSDDELVDTWLNSLDQMEVDNAVNRFKNLSDTYQKSQFTLLDSRTQALLTANGYQLPHDHLNFWNPGDWGQYASNFLRNSSWKRMAALAPGTAVAGAGSVMSYGIKNTWQAVESLERFSSRMSRTLIEEAKGADGYFNNNMMALTWMNPKNFQTLWNNAEYQHASFTTEGREAASDLLDNEENFNIMIAGFRYQGLEEGAYEYFLEKNGGDKYAASLEQRDFLTSGIVETPEWEQAHKQLADSSTDTFKYGLDSWEWATRQMPQYMGGLRGRPEAQMEDASPFYRTLYPVSGFGAAMTGSLIFDPLLAIDIATWGRQAVKAGVYTDDMARWTQNVDVHWRRAAGMRAYDEARTLHKAGEDWSVAAKTSKKTDGMFVETDVDWTTPDEVVRLRWAREEGDDWIRRSSFGIRRNLREVNEEIDAIVNSFIEFDKWRSDQIMDVVSSKGFVSTSPLYRTLVQRNPAYRDALPLMLEFHDNARYTYYADEAVDGVHVASKGLSTYDGVWEFLRSSTGNRALSRGLGTLNTEKLMLPTLRFSSRVRLRANDTRERFMRAKDPFEEAAPFIWAESVAEWLSTREGVAIRQLQQRMKLAREIPLSNHARGLTEY